MEISGYMPKLFNMSITGGIIILVVLLVRLCLKKAPKIFSYVLWLVVLIRLLCPVSVSSPVSVLNLLSQKSVRSGRMEYIPERVTKADHPFQTLNIPAPDTGDSDAETNPSDNHNNKLVSVSAFELYGAAAFVWIIGLFGLLIYGNVQFVWLKEKLVGAMPLCDNIYLADHIASPFVLGMIRPKIYMPSSLSDTERDYIILHEQHHIKRFDHITRILAYLALCIHWFNPLVWVAFVLSGTDMEMSCDEAVMKSIGEDIREDYSRSLISLATGRRIISGTPLAFGEGSTKSRIKNVMSYKKPAFWVMILAVAACVITSGCVLTNPVKTENVPPDKELYDTGSDEELFDAEYDEEPSGSESQEEADTSIESYDSASHKYNPEYLPVEKIMTSNPDKPYNETTDHYYALENTVTDSRNIPDGSVVHVCSLGYANNHNNYYFYYKDDKPVRAEYIASIQGTPDAIEAAKTAEKYSGVILTDRKEVDHVYVLFEIDMRRDGKKYLNENHAIFSGQDDWSWAAVKKTLEENGYACDTGFDREMTACIKGLMGEYIWLDEVEWVQVPGDRADELNITDEDAPDGFYIYDDEFLAKVYLISESCRITATDLRMNSWNTTDMSLAQFTDMFNETGDFKKDMAFQIKIENGEVTEIAQRYQP